MKMEDITIKQIKCIKTVQRKFQPDDEYHEMLKLRFNVESCKDLTRAQAGKLIDLYKKWGWATNKESAKPKRKTVIPRQSGNMTKMVSPAQNMKIGVLAEMVEWRVKDGLTRWLSKRFRIDRVRTAQQAWQVTEGLKKMIERQMKTQYGPGWKSLDYDDSRIRRFISGG